MDLIDRSELRTKLAYMWYDNCNLTAKDIEKAIFEAQTVEAVAKELYEQIKWERDIAISQLESYGVQFGEQADCVRVVRCKDCVFYYEDEDRDCGLCTLINDGDEWFENDFCSYGQ